MSSIAPPDLEFLVSFIKGKHKFLLSKTDFLSLVNKPYEEFISELITFNIAEKLKETDYKPHEIERLLTSSLLDQHIYILKHSPTWAKPLFEAYSTQFEVMNIQRILRYLYSQADVNLKEVINLKAQEILGRTAFISRLIQCENLPSLLEKLKESEYKEEITIAEEIYDEVGDIWPLEFALESYFLKSLYKQAKKIKRNEREGALYFANYEILKNILLVILRADFIEIDVEDAIRILPIPEKDFPYRNYIDRMMKIRSLQHDLEVLEEFGQEKVQRGIELYRKDNMFQHIELAIRARELELVEESYYHNFGILAILSYLKKYKVQIEDLNKLLYLKEHNFPIEKTKELIVNLV